MRLLLVSIFLAAACGGAGGSASAGLPGTNLDGGGDPGSSPDAGAGSPQGALQAPPPGSLYHGVLPAGAGQPDSDISPAALDLYEQTVGRKVAYVYFDDEWLSSRSFPATTTGWIKARGAVPFIRLMLRSQKIPLITDPVFTLDNINAGRFDADLAAWADSARDYGAPLIVEYGTEVNGDWNPWSAPYNGGIQVAPAKFKQAYRHIVQVMRGQGATNITWALHYAGQSFPGDDPRNVPVAYYPGDDVVDWVGISAYGSERSNDTRCPTFRSLLDAMLPQLRTATAVKPLFVFEIGITNNNPACPAVPWVQAAFGDLLGGRWPDVRGFAWWNQGWKDDPSIGGSTDMLVQDDTGITQAFRSAVSSAAVIDLPILH